MKNPFASSLFAPGQATVASIHQNELDALFTLVRHLEGVSLASPEPGASLLLTASRAGAGKTHFLARCQALTAGHGFWIPLRFAPEQDLSWKELTLALASRLHSARTQGISQLDEVAWFAFSRLVQAGLGEGKVVVEDPPAAREQLDTRFREIFAPGTPESRFDWFSGTAKTLLASCGTACATSLGCEPSALAGWMRWLLTYTSPKSDPANRWERLALSLERAAGKESTWKECFQALARLASGVAPLVWSVDHLDRFFSVPQASRQLISQLSEVATLVPRSLLIFSANQDLWQQTMMPGVPGALQDRLAAHSIQLGPLTPEQAEELVTSRLYSVARADEKSRAFLRRLNFHQIPGSGGLTPRAILRWASAAWDMRENLPNPVTDTNSSADPQLSVQRAREKLHAVAEALRSQSGPGLGEIPALVPHPTAPLPPPLQTQATAPPSLAQQFQEIRLCHLSGQSHAPDWKRIQRLVATVGQRFPSIRQRHLDSGTGTNGEALCWAIADREIFIGFAPPTSYRFWRHLNALASEPDTSGKLRLRKVVILLPAGEPVSPEALKTEESGVPVDLIPIDADLAATLHAADDLLQANLRHAGGLSDARLFGFLAKELDFFWRRLTRRPVETAGVPAETSGAGTA
ncbi:MAG: hypothetical protein DVB23_002669 [Verrucomicrobia bacterium]|nr:MAG: hypothetical protein DVB23_002669 [Verrucomicrobiota bacterium]